jgi:hypothetical protein
MERQFALQHEINVILAYGEFENSSIPNHTNFHLLKEVTLGVDDYSSITVNETTYRYFWDIVVTQCGGLVSIIPPPGLYHVDAATAEIIPMGPPF